MGHCCEKEAHDQPSVFIERNPQWHQSHQTVRLGATVYGKSKYIVACCMALSRGSC